MDETPLVETALPASRGFRVPFGVDAAGDLVAPNKATRAVLYVCPACADKLTYRAGPIVSAHFAHRGGTGCTPESVLHASTKLRVAEAVRVWLAGSGPRPTVRRRCSCGWTREDPIKDGVAAVSLEHRLHVGDRDVVADLALIDGNGSARLLIEILVFHAVDAEKAAALRAAKLPWIELDAERAQPDAAVWEPFSYGNIRPLDCPECAAREQARRDEIVATAAAIGVSTEMAGYDTQVYTCYRCGKKTLLFLWHGMFENSVPPSPRPKTIQFRYSSVVERKYWTNTCGHCPVMFGNHYVQLEVGGTSFHEEEIRLYDQRLAAELAKSELELRDP